MATTLTTPADPPGGSPVRPRGILAVAAPAPQGWELGGIQVSQACPAPVITRNCISLAGDRGGSSPTQAKFTTFTIEQSSECSTLALDDREQEARDALNDSTDYALGLTLLGGEVNGSPSLSEAESVGSFTGAVSALAELEIAVATAGQGVAHMLHASPAVATHLASAGLIDNQGRAPSGAQWIISSGYSGTEADGLQIWATGRVWAAAGAITTHENVNRPQNQREAWAIRSAIVGFNPCVNHTVIFTPTPAGGGMNGLSAYEVAVEDGFEGTESEWLESLVGPPGTDGVVQSVVAGEGVSVDDSDPANPVITTV